MSLKLRKQYPEFEIYEATSPKEVSVAEAVSEIRDFDWDAENKKSAQVVELHAEPAIQLVNHAGSSLYLHFTDGKFSIAFTKKGIIPRSTLSLVGSIESLTEILRLFDLGDETLLDKRLQVSEFYTKAPMTTDVILKLSLKEATRDSREIVNQEFTYQVRPVMVFKRLFWSAAYLLMAPAIFGYFAITKGEPISLGPMLIMQVFTSLFAAPGIVIAINHWRWNGYWRVFFKKGDNTFFIVQPSGKEMFNKTDFVSRITTENPSSNAPWNGFDYTTLVRADGRQLHISDLLIPTHEVHKLFWNIEETIERKAFQIIRDKKITTKGKMHPSLQPDP